jgi:hypothetical protein
VIGRAARRRISRVSVARMLRLALLAAVVMLVAASSAHAQVAAARTCGDVTVNRFLKDDPNGTFGAFGISAKGTGCAKARSVAHGFIHKPSAIERGSARIQGYRCTFRTTEVQQVQVTCKRHNARVRFRDEIPNG